MGNLLENLTAAESQAVMCTFLFAGLCILYRVVYALVMARLRRTRPE